ncbi:hypothetical protein ABPG72_021218 [Tetrahymena utriculariae]
MSKNIDAIFAGSLSVLTTVAGGLVLAATGPVGMIVGSVILGAGISGGVDAVQQGLNEEEEFSFSKWGKNVGVGASTGFIGGGCGAVGTKIAATVATNMAKKIAIQAAAQAVGGAVSGGVATCANKEITASNVIQGVVIGAVSGGLSAGASSAITSQIAQESTSKVTQILTGTASGAVVGGSVSSVSKVAENIINGNELDEGVLESFCSGAVIGGVSGAITQTAKVVNDELAQKNQILLEKQNNKMDSKLTEGKEVTIPSRQQGFKKDDVKYIKENGKVYVKKNNLDGKQIQNYNKLKDLKIGVNCKGNECDGYVVMEKRPPLTQELGKNAISDKKAYEYLKSLDKVQNTLIKNKIQHTDVKPSNVVTKGNQLLLIDSDGVQNIGEIRKQFTPNINTRTNPTLTKASNGRYYEKVTQNTDQKGFDYCRKQILSKIDNKEHIISTGMNAGKNKKDNDDDLRQIS